ncbi:hypothetical protein SISSUDRAFT_1067649 [Sistotremastrum suecicum HHB10207 ss-3]|uniref:Uncharacterized protein n=1 Tax=Sistotremastrum suecicum HHB10207 ss-3 TaxID=1314776 RepID=A0A165WVW4_9AGAM|nr:hypothetical protein SISSUDRAFT_1067649 [Sistotremastrum suecicum HHB10207 ss-3]
MSSTTPTPSFWSTSSPAPTSNPPQDLYLPHIGLNASPANASNIDSAPNASNIVFGSNNPLQTSNVLNQHHSGLPFASDVRAPTSNNNTNDSSFTAHLFSGLSSPLNPVPGIHSMPALNTVSTINPIMTPIRPRDENTDPNPTPLKRMTLDLHLPKPTSTLQPAAPHSVNQGSNATRQAYAAQVAVEFGLNVAQADRLRNLAKLDTQSMLIHIYAGQLAEQRDHTRRANLLQC